MCVPSIKVPIGKKSGNLFNDHHIYNYLTVCKENDHLKYSQQNIHLYIIYLMYM